MYGLFTHTTGTFGHLVTFRVYARHDTSRARVARAARADAAPRARVAAPQSSPDARARDVRANAIAEPPRASTFERDERDERDDDGGDWRW